MKALSEDQSRSSVSLEFDPEYPRPQFRRSHWQSLNGPWEFSFDDGQVGETERWFLDHAFPLKIVVPFVYESTLSQIHDLGFHDVVWYRRTFEISPALRAPRLVLHFGAVDYACRVWINGQLVGSHQGGHVPFSLDITAVVEREKPNVVVVRVEDDHQDLAQPRGKQYWKPQSESIFYTRTTGIWQTVWLEAVAPIALDGVRMTPDLDDASVRLEVSLQGPLAMSTADLWLDVVIFDGADAMISQRSRLGPDDGHCHEITLCFDAGHPVRAWSPEDPYLYRLQYRLGKGQEILDEVESYLGMRKLSVQDGQFFLNGHPYYLKMVLDQGYFPEGILTAPTPLALKRDVILTKQMGFNGVRKHQKVEDPVWLAFCDQLGLLVWEEMPNSYTFNRAAVERITHEWTEVLARDYNHPCIMAWVPINESWGVPDLQGDARQRAHLSAMYYLTKSLDPTRLVISNDGWEHAHSDLLTIHDYEGQGSVLTARYQELASTLATRPSERPLYVTGFAYQGQPIFVTEMGGISYQQGSQSGWGYTTAVSAEDFIERFRTVIQSIGASPVIRGFCYTQLTDVEQEINGILTADRLPKVPWQTIRKVVDAAAGGPA